MTTNGLVYEQVCLAECFRLLTTLMANLLIYRVITSAFTDFKLLTIKYKQNVKRIKTKNKTSFYSPQTSLQCRTSSILCRTFLSPFSPRTSGLCLFPFVYSTSLISSISLYLMFQYRDWETDRKSTRLNSSHCAKSRMPSSA